jgi:DNA-binding transcriptional LysR family regulator
MSKHVSISDHISTRKSYKLNPLRNIDLNLLVVFEAIYSSGNITSAARKLGVTQPTISNALNRLRHSIGDPLFVREGRGVIPTPRAGQLIEFVRQALALIEDGIASAEKFDPVTEKRHFRIAVLDMLEPVIMPALVREIQAQSNVTFDILPAFDGNMLTQALNSGAIELIVADYQPQIDETSCQTLGPTTSVAIARKGHPQIDGELTRELYSQLGHVAIFSQARQRIHFTEVLERLDIQRNVIYGVTRFWSFPHMIANSDLIGTVPIGFAKAVARQYGLQILSLPFPVPDEQSFYMTWKTNNDDRPHHIWLRNQIASIYSDAHITPV